MRNRMKQLARGRFEYEVPTIHLSDELISITVIEGEDYSGSFSLSSENDRKIRGVCYSTNERMECMTPQFDGQEVRIRYQLHSKGLVDQEVIKGEFVIVCNEFEYSLPFVVTITRNYLDSSNGFIKNLYDFSCLAKDHWDEAYQLFYRRGFSDIIKPNEVKEMMIYRGIVQAKPSNGNLEEFLVGIGKKERLKFACERNEFTFGDLEESVKETITIRKENWGYIDISLSTDSDFIELPKKKIQSNDFIGSTCQVEFFVRKEALHAGNNYGRILLKSAFQLVEIPVNVIHSIDENTAEAMKVRRDKKENEIGLLELYQAYRLKRLSTAIWANETIEILNHLHAIEPEEPMYLLMKAQALLINRQRQECEWILEDFKREWIDKNSEVWAYYLYILTLMEREPVYVDKLTAEIKLIFHQNPDSSLIFWILLFLEENYFNNNSLKLKAIEYWVNKGCTSPYIYLEAYYLIWQDPYLLTKLDSFELRLLRWAVRKKAMNKDIAAQIFQILSYTKEFSPVYYELMCAAYEADPRPEYVGTIVSYLIRTDRYETKYHDWYVKGIELELRVTGLYEAYLMSLDDRNIAALPKMIQLYFRYESSLPYKKLAVLYNNIIAAKESDPDTYNQYRRTMGRFAMEQVEAEHMDDNLAVLYEDMLDLGLVNEELAHALSHIVFTNKLIVFENNLVRVIVYQRQMKEPQIVPITDNVAYFQLFSKDYAIIFEDANGLRYVGDVSYRLQPLMNVSNYLDKAMLLATDEASFVAYRFKDKHSYLTFSPEDKEFFRRILFANDFSKEFMSEMVPEIIRYLTSSEYDSAMREFLDTVDVSDYDPIARKFLMEQFVENHLYERAVEAILEYGIDQIGSSYKVALCNRLILENQYDEDDALVRYCTKVFCDGKYTDLILDYLCKYYTGPSNIMLKLWKAARGFDIDTFDLEEKILTQLMYAGKLDASTYQVFSHYYDGGGRELIILAYISYMSHEYFVHQKELSNDVFQLLEGRYINHLELNDACKLALLKKLSEVTVLSEKQYQIEDELLSEFTNRNMNFAFYKKLDKRLVSKYHFNDKVFLEYRTSPLSHVILNYNINEETDRQISEDMVDVYDGIFVKSFVMFFGERIHYYISEERGSVVNVSESMEILNNDVYGEDSESRYNLLNQMMISSTLQEDALLLKTMNRYYGFEKVSKDAFQIL